MKIFNRKKININSVSVPDFGWHKEMDNKQIKQWINPEQTIALSLNFFDLPPDIPTIKDVRVLRNLYRTNIVAHKGGIVQVDLLEIKKFPAIKTILKIPQQPIGITYLASLTIPFENYSYVVKIQAPELGTTGIRETVMVAKFLSEGKISIGENALEGWFSDPYDPEFQEGTLMNKSEEPQYDADFPKHPLSRVRHLLTQIERKIEFGTELETIKKFGK